MGRNWGEWDGSKDELLLTGTRAACHGDWAHRAHSDALQEVEMPRITEVSVPEMAMIVGTRVLLGIGIGLLASDRMDRPVRRGVGWTMLLVGAVSTIPLAVEAFSGRLRRLPTNAQSAASPTVRLPESRL